MDRATPFATASGSASRFARLLPRVGIAACFAIATVVMAGPYTNFTALGTASYQGDARLISWTLTWDNYATLHGLPLFDAPIFYPEPGSLAYNEHLFGLSLFTLPVYALTGNPLLGFNLVMLCSWFANGLAAYALARRFVRDRLAAAVGGLIYAFSFYRMQHAHAHAHLVWAFLIPLSLIALDRWMTRPTWLRAIIWGTAVVLEVLTSWYMAILVLLANAVFGVGLLAHRWSERRAGRLEPAESANHARLQAHPGPFPAALRVVAHVVVVATVAVFVVRPFAAPYAHLPATSMSEAAGFSADLTAFVYPPLNTWIGRWLSEHGDRRPRWIWGERTLYLGATASVLTAIGLVASLWPGRRRRWLPDFSPTLAVSAGLLGVLGLSLALGPSPEAIQGRGGWAAYDLLARIPFLSSARAPARFAELVLLAQVLTGAAGAAWLHHRFGRQGRIATAVLIPLMLSEWFVVGFPAGKPPVEPIPPVYSYLATLPPAPVVSLPTPRERAVPWFLQADYLYFQTAHWRPIVNGFGRAEPKSHFSIINHMSAFAGTNSARTMRRIGVGYVVLHAGRYPDRAAPLVAQALAGPDFELVRQFGDDYLFRVRPGTDPPAPSSPKRRVE